jgi:hypothetical protein
MARGHRGYGPANVMRKLHDMKFPARKIDLIEHARQSADPDREQVAGALEEIEDRSYKTPGDVLREVGRKR